MNKLLLAAAIILATTTINRAEIVTLVADASNPSGGLPKQIEPSVLELDDSQAAELLSFPWSNLEAHLEVVKSGSRMKFNPIEGEPRDLLQKLVVAGPARIELYSVNPHNAMMASFRITPERVDPTKTIIVLPGTNNAAKVALLCSTNLTDWSEATNGIYSGNVAKLFRIGLEPLEPKR